MVEIHTSSADRITSLSVADHAGLAEEGSDVICAAASTLVYTAIGALEDLCGWTDFYRIVSDDDGESIPFSEITCPATLSDETSLRTAQVILQTVRIGFLQLELTAQEDYGNQYIQVQQIMDDKLEV